MGARWGLRDGLVGAIEGSALPPAPACIQPCRDSAGASSAARGVGPTMQTPPAARGRPLPTGPRQLRWVQVPPQLQESPNPPCARVPGTMPGLLCCFEAREGV